METTGGKRERLPRSVIFGASGILIIVVLALIVTDGQPTSALALLKGVGVAGVLTGVLTQQLPALLPTLALGCYVAAIFVSLAARVGKSVGLLLAGLVIQGSALVLTPARLEPVDYEGRARLLYGAIKTGFHKPFSQNGM